MRMHLPINKMTGFFALMAVQVVLLVLYYIFVEYSEEALPIDKFPELEEQHVLKYPQFQDVHVMIFLGFGFLMTFLRKYGYSASGYSLFLAALIVQWAILVKGFFQLVGGKITLSLDNIIEADIAAAVPLISMGALLGRTTPIQLLFMAMFEMALFAINEYLQLYILAICDIGGSITVHAFGAYFGLAVSFMLRPSKSQNDAGKYEGASYNSDLFAMVGTLFLWVYWPSFNSVLADGTGRERAILNTYLSLAAATVATFVLSIVVSHGNKFDMVHVQNSALAGGVAVGSVCNLLIGPHGAILIGICAGVVSVLGYHYLTPMLQSFLRIHDTCGVHNLHGMPALISAIASAIYAALVTREMYQTDMEHIFPAMGSENWRELQGVDMKWKGGSGNDNATFPMVLGGYNRSAFAQSGFQLLGVVITVAIAIVGGILMGTVLKYTNIRKLTREEQHQDAPYWEVPEQKEE